MAIADTALKKIAENPEVSEKVQAQIERLFLHRGSSPEDVQLDQCHRAAQLLNAPGATAGQRRVLKKKVGALRSDVFEAFLLEQDEGAQVEGR